MSININKITQNHVAAVVSLMREFAEYEGLSEYCTVTEARLSAAMFGDGSIVEGLIAFVNDVAIAYAMYYPSFSSFRGERGLFLEDIYIREEYRRHNLGGTMLREIAGIAKMRGCERIDFMVLEGNTSAVSFYLKHGAKRNDDERHFKFAGAAFEKLAS